MGRPTPIRVKDRFVDREGRVWEVIWCKPGGVVELFCKAKSRFIGTYKKQLRAENGAWTPVKA